MNILVVNWQDRENPAAGGAEIHLFEILTRLAAGGHRVRLVCGGWPGAPTRATVDGVDITRVGDRHSFTLRGRGAVRAALAAEPADIVVEDINKLPLYLANLTDLPFYVIIPHLFGATVFQEASLPVAALVWLAERPVPAVYRRAAFHAISESTRDDLVDRGVPAGRIRVIHPGVDPEWFRPDPAVSRSLPPTFLYLGRLKRYKGVDLALRALARAHDRRPDLILDIAGTGDDRPRLERLAAELGLGERVRFHGFVTEEAKRDLLRRAWANVFPSPKEGWGITNVEAAACATPVLASDSPGLRDSIQPGVTGFLVPHGDVDALADRMLALAGDPGLVERMGAAGRTFALGLTWADTARQTEAHMMETIAGRLPA